MGADPALTKLFRAGQFGAGKAGGSLGLRNLGLRPGQRRLGICDQCLHLPAVEPGQHLPHLDRVVVINVHSRKRAGKL